MNSGLILSLTECLGFLTVVLLIVVPDQPEYESSDVPGYRRQFRRAHKLAAPSEGRGRTINPNFDEGMVEARSNPPGRIIIRPRRPAPRKGFPKKKQAAQKQVRGQKKKKRQAGSNPVDYVQLKKAGRQRNRRSIGKRAASGSNKFPDNQEATRDRHHNHRRHRRSPLDTDPDVGKLPNQQNARSDTKAQHEHPASDVSTGSGSVPLLHAQTEPASQHSGRTSYLSDTSKLLTGNDDSAVPLGLREGSRGQHARHRQQATHKVAEDSSSVALSDGLMARHPRDDHKVAADSATVAPSDGVMARHPRDDHKVEADSATVAPSDGVMARHPRDEHKISGPNKQTGAAESLEVDKDVTTTQSSDKRLPAHTDSVSQPQHAATAGRLVHGSLPSRLDMHNETGADVENATKAKHYTRKEHSTHKRKTPVYEHLSSSSGKHKVEVTGDDLDSTSKDEHLYSGLDAHNETEYGLDYDSNDVQFIHKRKTLVSSGVDPRNAKGENVYYDTEDDKINRDYQDSVTEDDTSNEHTIHKRMAPDLNVPVDPSLPLDLRMAVVSSILFVAPWSERRALSGKVELSCRNDAVKGFKDQVPMMKTQWLHNGDPLKVQASRMLFRGDDLLVIQDLRATDTGVYECRVDYGGKKALTVAFFALTVTSTIPTLLPRQTEPLTLDCHSQDMAHALLAVDVTVESDPDFGCTSSCDVTNMTQRTTRQWFHNDTETSLLPADGPATEPKADTLTSSTRDMSGVWRCVVSHAAGQRQWNTSWYRVYVKDPPSALELWWHGALTKPWVVALVGTVVLVTCIGVSTLVARHAQKQDENLEERWQVMKTRMMRKASRIGSFDTGISVSKNKLDNSDDSMRVSLSSQTDVTRIPSRSPSGRSPTEKDSMTNRL